MDVPPRSVFPTLIDAAQKLLLLADEGADWPYAYIRMNDAMAQMLLSSIGHIGIMAGDLPSWNACGCLHQLCVWQLLQCGGWVVCHVQLQGVTTFECDQCGQILQGSIHDGCGSR